MPAARCVRPRADAVAAGAAAAAAVQGRPRDRVKWSRRFCKGWSALVSPRGGPFTDSRPGRHDDGAHHLAL
eukprot:365084-Chlamydomonas_euryale.AAC.21